MLALRRLMLACTMLVGATGGVAAAAGVASGPGAPTGPSVSISQVSGGSPFTPNTCVSDPSGPFAGTHGLEIAPTFTVTDRGLVAAWQQDGGLGVVAARSEHDDGRSWTRTVPPATSICENGGSDLRVVGGPVITNGSGTTIALWGPSDPVPDPRGGAESSRSTDGGRTWSQPIPVIPNGFSLTSVPVASPDPADPIAATAVFENFGPNAQLWVTRTTDDGKSWQPPLPILRAPAPDAIETYSLVTLHDGTLVVVAWAVPFHDAQVLGGILPTGPVSADPVGCTDQDPAPCETRIHAYVSKDNGASWTDNDIVTLHDQNFMRETTNAPPAAVIGPDGSVNVLVPVDDPQTGQRTWQIDRSFDGTEWSPVIGINVPLGHDDIYWKGTGPSLAIARDGTIAVLYTDHHDPDRQNRPCTDPSAAPAGPTATPGSTTCTTDVWMTYSQDGKSWNTLHLGGPFDIEVMQGWVGEFVDLHALKNGVGAVFSLGACEAGAQPDCVGATDGPTDVFFARIGV